MFESDIKSNLHFNDGMILFAGGLDIASSSLIFLKTAEWTKTHGPRAVVTIGAVVAGAGMWVTAGADGPFSLIMGKLFMEVGLGAMYISAIMSVKNLISDPSTRTFWMAVVGSESGLGQVGVGLIANALICWGFDWKSSIKVMSLLCLTAAAAGLAMTEQGIRPAADQGREDNARRSQEAKETNDDGASLETRELPAEESIGGKSHFNLNSIADYFSVLGLYIPYGVLPDQARGAGMSIWNANALILGMGGGSTTGRIAAGAMVLWFKKKPLSI